VLEQVRLLSNFETDSQKLLQIVLVGQLDLDLLLERPELRQLRQRISRRHQLEPLKPYEVEQYVERRLWVAHGGLGLAKIGRVSELAQGDRFWRVRFTRSAMRAVAELSRGLPRSINVICDRALECAFGSGKKVIDAHCVMTAARQLQLDVPVSVWLSSNAWPAVAASVAVLAVAGWFAFRPAPTTSPDPLVPPVTLGTPSGPAGLAPASDVSPEAVAAAVPAAPLAEAISYAVAVASFRTDGRADEVARSLKMLDLPAYVQTNAEGWHSVFVGPFASRDEARDAQSQVARVHLTDSHIVTTSPALDGSPAHALQPVATTGEKGQP
jgi:general secretion pathway protein A